MTETRPADSKKRRQRSPSRGVRERRLRHEAVLLGHARDVVSRVGIAGLTIEEVAQETGYTRGALYRYFRSKEDIVIALAMESMRLRVALGEEIRRWDARPREQMMAMGEASSLLFPRHFLTPRIAFASSLHSATKERELEDLFRRDYLGTVEITRDAVEHGDLVVPEGLKFEELALGVHGFLRGICTPLADATPLEEHGVTDLPLVIRRLNSRFLDGFGWRPLSSDWDYEETLRRIASELLTPTLLASLGLLEGATDVSARPLS